MDVCLSQSELGLQVWKDVGVPFLILGLADDRAGSLQVRAGALISTAQTISLLANITKQLNPLEQMVEFLWIGGLPLLF